MFVGGTGLYIDAFFKGLSDIPDIDASVKAGLEGRIIESGSAVLHEELKKIDPDFAGKIHPNDRQRILRGLEVYYSTGNPISLYYSSMSGYGSDETVFIGISCGREILRNRINERVDGMISGGFLNEVRFLRSAGYGPELKSMRSIGYLELNRHLDGELTFEEAVQLIKTNTARYAKRQMTWFRKNSGMVWFEAGEIKKIKEYISASI